MGSIDILGGDLAGYPGWSQYFLAVLLPVLVPPRAGYAAKAKCSKTRW